MKCKRDNRLSRPLGRRPRPPFMFRFLLSLLVVHSLLTRAAFSQEPPSPRKLTIEKIELVGNSKTRESVILRYVTFRPGDQIAPNVLANVLTDNREGLKETNFFKEVEFYTEPGSEKGNIIVFIEVKERHWPFYQFEGGYTDLDGWYFIPASLRFDNFFGHGNLFGLSLTIGDRISELSLAYENSSLFNNNTIWSVELLGASKQFNYFIDQSQATHNVGYGGLRLSIRGQRGLFKYLTSGYRTENYEPDNFIKVDGVDSTVTDLPPEIAADLGRTRISALSVALGADLRDNVFFPRRGFWGALSGEIATDVLGSDRNFPKLTLDTRFYLPVFERETLAFHVKAGYTKEETPFYDRFYLGGANSLRGYPFQRLTPLGGATKLFLAQTEVRFPISQKNYPNHNFSGVLFFDAGGNWQTGETPKTDDLFYSIGFGLRAKLPLVGMTRFDFGFPLRIVGDSGFQLNVALGHTF